MYDQEIDINAPYDNVEFPVRKPGTGTWPGPVAASAAAAGGGGLKLYGHQTLGRSAGGPKLAPLVEVEGSEGADNNRMQMMSFGSTAATLPSSPSSTIKNQQHQPQPQPQPQQINSQSSQARVVTAQNQVIGGLSGTPAASTTTSAQVLSPSATAITTTSSTTSATTTVASSGFAKTASSAKPVIVVTNDSNLYIDTKVTSGETPKKKTQKQVETEEEDFKRQDLNPASRLALERVYTLHPDFYQLNTKVLDEGNLLKQDVLDIYRRTGETLTYEQLLQGILVDGERFLLGSCWLYFTHVQFVDLEGVKTLREPYGRGRLGLTNKRVLFLSNEIYSDANLEQFQVSQDDKKQKSADQVGYKLEVSKRSCIVFKNIPLSNFHSAEMEVLAGTAAQTKITKKRPCCSCFGMMSGKWVSTPPMTRSINSRVMRVGVSMPPWQTRMFVDIHLDPTMSLTVARDFISQLHAFAPHMH